MPRLPHRFDKKKKREIFTSKLLVYYVVLQVFNHIGISPPTPDASLISQLIYAIFVLERYKNGLNIYKKTNNLCSF